jgi:hypothetical protein
MFEPSARLIAKIQTLFPPSDAAYVVQWLTSECGANLSFADALGKAGIERVQAAVVKLSNGSLDNLATCTGLAQADWRDALIAADFGSDACAHELWLGADHEPNSN